jgi:hypothetical protein
VKLFYFVSLLLLFCITVRVQAAAPAKWEQRQKSFTEAKFKHQLAVDKAKPVFIKLCKGRFLTPAPPEKNAQDAEYYCDCLYLNVPLSSFHTLLTRLLLFPRHYFW